MSKQQLGIEINEPDRSTLRRCAHCSDQRIGWTVEFWRWEQSAANPSPCYFVNIREIFEKNSEPAARNAKNACGTGVFGNSVKAGIREEQGARVHGNSESPSFEQRRRIRAVGYELISWFSAACYSCKFTRIGVFQRGFRKFFRENRGLRPTRHLKTRKVTGLKQVLNRSRTGFNRTSTGLI